MKINKFQDLEVWQLSIEIVVQIYKLCLNLKFAKDFGLRDQIRRAVVSIASNIAEGFEMSNNNDFIRFLRIAKGSIGEVKTQIYIALKIGYITEKEYEEVAGKLDLLSSKVGSFMNYLYIKKSTKEYKTR